MAVQTVKGHEIPPGTIRLTKAEACSIQFNLIKSLTTTQEHLFLRYGSLISSVSSAASSLYFNRYYREVFRNGPYRLLFSFFPSVMVPSILTLMSHDYWVRNNIIVQEMTCPVCYHMRSATIQTTFGLVWPLVTSSYISMVNARKLKLHGVPGLNKVKEAWEYYKSVSMPRSKIGNILLLQMTVGSLLAQLEMYQFMSFIENLPRLTERYDRIFMKRERD